MGDAASGSKGRGKRKCDGQAIHRQSSPVLIIVGPMLCRRIALGQRSESRLLNARALLYLAGQQMEVPMKKLFGRLAASLLALALTSGFAAAQSKVTIAIGGGACLCYLPTVLAKQLGEYEKAGLAVELVDLKGGSDALKAVLGGSADVVSGYFDHCVNLAAKKQELQSFVVFDRYPGLVLVVSPKHMDEIKSIKDLAGKKVGVTAPGSSTDFFLKFLLKKNGLDPTSASVIGVGLNATAVAAMEQGQVDAAVMADPSVTVLQGSYPDLRILSDTRTQKDNQAGFGGGYPGGALFSPPGRVALHEKGRQAVAKTIVETTERGNSP